MSFLKREARPPNRSPDKYPTYVGTAEERRRWDLAEAVARQHFGDFDEASVWMATRSLYNNPDIPTGE